MFIRTLNPNFVINSDHIVFLELTPITIGNSIRQAIRAQCNLDKTTTDANGNTVPTREIVTLFSDSNESKVFAEWEILLAKLGISDKTVFG